MQVYDDNQPMQGELVKPVWIVDDDRSIRWVLEKALAREGIAYKTFASARDVLQALQQSQPQVLVSDIRMPGESGLGKELVARALHRHSPRAGGPFVAINTAAIPKDLLESELFGHERGAFTGAQSARRGRFEEAESGTLFLDEIGDMPPDLQVRLLRVLSDGEYYRVGGPAPLKSKVRIIAATHQNLDERVRQGLFREDLLHRLNVGPLRLPPLRERGGDIP